MHHTAHDGPNYRFHQFLKGFCEGGSSFKETFEEPLSKPTLCILKWNANGHSTRAQELCDRLAAESIDVCLIQETNTRLSRVDCLTPPHTRPGLRGHRFPTCR